MVLPKRNEVEKAATWDLSKIFKDKAAFENEYQKLDSELNNLEEPTFLNGQILKDTLDQIFNLKRRVEKIYVYATLNSDVDTANNEALAVLTNAQSLAGDFAAKTAFLKPNILAIKPDKLKEFFKQTPTLKKYAYFIEQIVKKRAHTLTKDQEELIAQAEEVMKASENTYNVLSNSDLDFGYVQDEDGEMVQLSQGLYSHLIQSSNPEIRKMAFDVLYQSYDQFANTFAQTLQGQVKAHNFNAQVHHYQSAKEAALFENQIDSKVYDTLIKEVNDHLDLLHHYTALRKKVLDLKELNPWDLYTPLTGKSEIECGFEQAKIIIKQALEPLGGEYLAKVDYLFNNRLIDYVESQNKTTGAYSLSSYDTDPYQLLNWQNDLDSVFTLIHETGHSIHTLFSNQTQDYVYSEYPTFLAEIASTTNENLLTEFLLKKIKEPTARAFILNHYLEAFRTTLYRQTQFAEFEDQIHQEDAEGISLTADRLNKDYDQINQRYYGSSLKAGSQIKLEWTRIPHFYYNFYVYQYATGFAAATYLANNLVKDPTSLTSYMSFLKAGSSKNPLAIMKNCQLDFTKPDYLQAAFKTFEKRLQEFNDLISK